MLVSAEKNNLYSKVTSKNSLTSRDYMANAYGRTKPTYYNEPDKEETEKNKKNTLKYAGIIAISAITILGITASLLSKRKIIDLKYIEDIGKQTQDVIKSTKVKEKAANAMGNFNTIKDDLWDRLTKNCFDKIKIGNINPLGFISKISNKITAYYHSISPKAYINEWNVKKMKVLDLANKEKIQIDIPDFETLYKTTANNMDKVLHEGDRITKGIFKKGLLKQITTGNIADAKIQDVAKNALSKITIEGKASPELSNALEELNNYKIKSFEKLLPKIRDICVGSAPTDLLTQVLSLLSLGVVVANSDTKEEKRSVVINLGIPLITALTTTRIALVKSISGGAALAFGLIFGEFASEVAKAITMLIDIRNKRNYEKIKAQVLEEQKNAL